MQVIICGLERCGTSYLAEQLHNAGITFGDIKRSDKFEHNGVFSINRSLQNYEKLYGIKTSFKDPLIITRFPLYKTIFPDAFYILCIRDEISAARSLVNTGVCENIKGGLARHKLHRDLAFKHIRNIDYVFSYQEEVDGQAKELSKLLGKKIHFRGWKYAFHAK